MSNSIAIPPTLRADLSKVETDSEAPAKPQGVMQTSTSMYVPMEPVNVPFLQAGESHFLEGSAAIFKSSRMVSAPKFDDNGFQKYKKSKRCELFSKKGPRAKDVRQGDLGDCFLLANLASLAHRHPQKIRQMVRDNKDGTYSVRFYKRGGGDNFVPEWITVDSKLPRVFDLNPLNLGWKKEVYAQARDTDLDRKEEIWVALVEKAFAIFDDRYGISDGPNEYREGYDGLDGGRPDTALEALIGHRAKTVRIFHFDDSELWRLLQHADKGACITAGSKGTSDGEFIANGIPGNHLYSVLGTEKDDGKHYVVLRNPWGHTEPNKLKGDGVFKIELSEFRESFQHVSYAAK